MSSPSSIVPLTPEIKICNCIFKTVIINIIIINNINIPCIIIPHIKRSRENILYFGSGRQVRKCASFFAFYFLWEHLLPFYVFCNKTRRSVAHSSYALSDSLEQMANSLGQNLPLTMCLNWVYYLLVIVIKDKNVNPTSFFLYWKRWAGIRKYENLVFE